MLDTHQSYGPAPRPISYWGDEPLEGKEWNKQQCKDCFSHLSPREEKEDSSPWEVKRAFLRGSQSCGWAWVVFLSSSLKRHCLSNPRDQQVKYSLSLPSSTFIIHFSYFWQIPNHVPKINPYWTCRKLAPIPRSTSTFNRLGFPQCSRNSHANLHPYTLSSCFSSHFWGGKKLIYNTIRVFCCFYKIFQDITKLHTLKG